MTTTPLIARPVDWAAAGAPETRSASRLRRAARAGASAVLVSLLLAAVALAGAAAVGVSPHVELSDSMAPALKAGDVLWLDRIVAADARVGDVVAFDDPERRAVVLHRVERVRPASGGRLVFRTRGDANNTSESWAIAAGGELGRYAGFRLPHVGRAVTSLQGPPLGAIAVLSASFLAALALRRIWS